MVLPLFLKLCEKLLSKCRRKASFRAQRELLDVLVIAFANGSPGAIAGAVMLMQVSIFGVIFMNDWLGLDAIHKLTRFCTIRIIPQNKCYVALFLGIYTLVPVVIFVALQIFL